MLTTSQFMCNVLCQDLMYSIFTDVIASRSQKFCKDKGIYKNENKQIKTKENEHVVIDVIKQLNDLNISVFQPKAI